MPENKDAEIDRVVDAAKKIAVEYERLTKRPLGVTGEIAEWTVKTLLGLELAPVRQSGFDAVRTTDGKTIQIKSRRIKSGKNNPGAKIGAIKLETEWQAVVLIELDDSYEPIAIYEASREVIERELKKTDSAARKRGQLSISNFRSVARQIWPR